MRQRILLKQNIILTLNNNDVKLRNKIVEFETIRFKYLDEEDILSLGFEKRDDNIYDKPLNGGWIKINVIKNVYVINVEDGFGHTVNCFQGNIKNIGELRFILNRI